ncbi:MAG: polysaccharide biosynthesis tyrosine autokinase [Bacteroidales bacterium]|jgi:capsular exopolysaccharide synthesis family protein|nr:polysaccharide biosynthesis tyrosine autokinase [Bacteroidales bacterium]
MAEPNELNANQNNQDGQDSQFDIHYLLNTLWRLRFWMVASVAVCLCVAFFYLKTKTDTYASQMMILITTDKNAGMSNSAQMSFIQDMTGFSSFNSLENEKVIIRSTPVVQKVVEEQELNVRYYVEQTFRNEETMCEEISMTYIPSPAYNVNRLPHIRIDYDIIDSTKMRISVLDYSRTQFHNKGYAMRDSVISLPGSVDLSIYGRLLFTFRPRAIDQYAQTADKDDDGQFRYATSGKHYIMLYSPQARAHEICNAIAVDVVNESRKSASFGSESSILSISLSDNLPQRAEAVLEGIVEQYNRQTKEYYTMSYSNTMEFIQNRLNDLKTQLSGVEGKIKDFSIGNNVYDLQSQTSFNLNSDMQRQQRAQEIDIQISLLEMISKELREQKEFTTIPSNVGITDNTIIASISEYNRLCVERLRLLSGSTESSPVVKQLYLQLEARRDLICKTIENQIFILSSQHDELMQQIGRNKNEMQRLPTQRLNLAAIEREQSVIEPLYVLLQKKREETMLAIIAEPDIARIVEHSENNSVFIGPNRRNTYLMALILGLMIPVLITYARMFLKMKIETPDDIISRTQIPILGIVPLGQGRITKAQEIIEQKSVSTTAEVFRSIRSSLTFSNDKVFQITSSIPSEGKSFVTTNLAVCFASLAKRTIVVETDMRKGHLRRTFDVPNEFKGGLSHYLSGQTDNWKEQIYKVPGIDGLDLMLKGTVPINPNELLSGERLEKLIEELRAAYDYVLLDSPPHLLIADPITINRVVDANIYVMRSGVSDLRFVNELNIAKANGKLTKPYIVLNGLDMKSQSYYGSRYGYGYGYAYGYAYGYNEHTEQKPFWTRIAKRMRKS